MRPLVRVPAKRSAHNVCTMLPAATCRVSPSEGTEPWSVSCVGGTAWWPWKGRFRSDSQDSWIRVCMAASRFTLTILLRRQASGQFRCFQTFCDNQSCREGFCLGTDPHNPAVSTEPRSLCLGTWFDPLQSCSATKGCVSLTVFNWFV